MNVNVHVYDLTDMTHLIGLERDMKIKEKLKGWFKTSSKVLMAKGDDSTTSANENSYIFYTVWKDTNLWEISTVIAGKKRPILISVQCQ